MANLAGLTVRRLVSEDRENWIRAFEDVFGGPLGGTDSAAHFDWLYRSIPGGHLWITLAVPSEDASPGGGIAASYSMIPRRFWANGEEHLGAVSIDTMTSPAWRKRGLFLHLAEHGYQAAAREDGAEFVCGFPNENSAHGFLQRLDWKPLPAPIVLVQIRPLALVRGTLGGRAPLEAHRGDLRARVVSEIDERFDVLWQRCRDRLGVVAVRDAHFFRWRYGKPFATYEILLAERSDGPVAACVTAVVPRSEGPRGLLMDFLAVEGCEADLSWLIRFATVRLARAHRTKIVQAAVSARSTAYPTLRQAGFRPLPKKLRPDMLFAWRPFSSRGEILGVDPDAWHVTYADTDTV